MSQVVILCHGRHLGTVGWEKLVWGDGSKIGTAPLALHLAMKKGALLVFGTGASEKDGLKECAFTRKFLQDRVSRLREFPEFEDYRGIDSYEMNEMFGRGILDISHLDTESQNTDQEVMNAVRLAKSLGATELIQVTSPFHAPRCAQVVGKLLDNGYDFGNVTCMVVSARSSTETCQAATTVILEHPHRGDDPMIDSSVMPHQVFPRMFKLKPPQRMEFFVNTADRLAELSV